MFINFVGKYRPTISWFSFLLIVTAYYTIILNYPILRHFYQILDSLDQYSLWFAISIPFVLFAMLLTVFTTLFSFKYIAKPVFFILLITSGAVYYSALKYNLLYDQDMIRNIFETNPNEAFSYLNAESISITFFSGVLPALLLCFVKIKWPKSILSGLLKRIGVILCSLFFIGFVAIFHYQSYASVGRNNHTLNKEIIPASYVYSTFKYLKQTYFTKKLPFNFIGKDATIENPEERPEIFVIIVGETARSENFKSNGYSRDTTPFTSNIQNLTFYPKVTSP